MNYWQTPEFKALQKAWYERLEAEGFVDAEEIVGLDVRLKQTADHQLQRANELEYETRQDYFIKISQCVEETTFKKDVDRLILAKHAQGLSHREIAQEIKEEGHPRVQNTVRWTIQRYRVKWGLPRFIRPSKAKQAG